MIYYFCPDSNLKSAGIRIIYRHVEILQKHGFAAAILHTKPGFRILDAPAVNVRYRETPVVYSAGDVVVIPEGESSVMNSLKDQPARRIVIALNWRYAFMTLPDATTWRDFGIERIITQSDLIGEYLGWAMKLPAQSFRWGIRGDLYFYNKLVKQPLVTFLVRKMGVFPELLRMLNSRNPDFFERITWTGLQGLTEHDYADYIRRSAMFLNLSEAEGLPCSLLEAMRSGTFVAGYNSVGGKRELIGQGEKQNCILAENLDYPDLARGLEPLLEDLMAGNVSNWESMRQNAIATAAEYTMEAEEESVLAMWRGLLQS